MSDFPSAFQTGRRKSRKHHRCCECGVLIEKGEFYQHNSGIWDKHPSSFKQCINCNEIMGAAVRDTQLNGYSDEFPSFGCLKDWFENQMCLDFSGKSFLQEMSRELSIDPENLNRLLKIDLTEKKEE